MFQVKQQNKTPNKKEISNLPNKEFKEMAKKILTKLKRIMTKLSKNFNEALVNTKKKKKIRVEEYSDRNKNTRGNQEQIT